MEMFAEFVSAPAAMVTRHNAAPTADPSKKSLLAPISKSHQRVFRLILQIIVKACVVPDVTTRPAVVPKLHQFAGVILVVESFDCPAIRVAKHDIVFKRRLKLADNIVFD